MPLIDRDGQAVADPWVEVETLDELPDGQSAILPAAVFQANRQTLEGRNAALGVRLADEQRRHAVGQAHLQRATRRSIGVVEAMGLDG